MLKRRLLYSNGGGVYDNPLITNGLLFYIDSKNRSDMFFGYSNQASMNNFPYETDFDNNKSVFVDSAYKYSWDDILLKGETREYDLSGNYTFEVVQAPYNTGFNIYHDSRNNVEGCCIQIALINKSDNGRVVLDVNGLSKNYSFEIDIYPARLALTYYYGMFIGGEIIHETELNKLRLCTVNLWYESNGMTTTKLYNNLTESSYYGDMNNEPYKTLNGCKTWFTNDGYADVLAIMKYNRPLTLAEIQTNYLFCKTYYNTNTI